MTNHCTFSERWASYLCSNEICKNKELSETCAFFRHRSGDIYEFEKTESKCLFASPESISNVFECYQCFNVAAQLAAAKGD